MKKKNNKIVTALVATVCVLGLAGIAGTIGYYGNEQGWFNSVDVDFKDVKIESKTFEYDGTNKELDIVVPEGATYEVTIKNSDGEVVNECKEIGDYTYFVKVTIKERSKEFTATLSIIEAADELAGSNLHQILMQKVSNNEYKLTATISPATATNQNLDWSLAFVDAGSSWANGKNVSDYVTLTAEGKTATVKMLKKFSEQMIVKAKSKDGSDVSATCTLDCKKGILSVEKKFNYLRNSSNIVSFSTLGADPTYDSKALLFDESNARLYLNASAITFDQGIDSAPNGINGNRDLANEFLIASPVYSEGTIEWSGDTSMQITSTMNTSVANEGLVQGIMDVCFTDWRGVFLENQGNLNLPTQSFTGMTSTSLYNWGKTVFSREPVVGDYVPLFDLTKTQYSGAYNYSFTFGIVFDEIPVSGISLDESNVIFE